MKRLALTAFALSLLASPALAQHAQPYAGLQTRPIKALSAEQVADLQAGRGMGLALAAELNGYPGPAHVIELADELSLSAEQRQRAQDLLAAMKAETVPLGQQILAEEGALDRAFAAHTITPAALAADTEAIGATQGKLRAAHLKYHLAMLAVLTPDQVKRYDELRGYGGGMPANHMHMPGMHHHAE